MKNGLPYYKAYPRDFIEGTIGMPFEIKCAYRVILDMIYMQRGKLPDDARYISGLLGCSIRKWKSIRSALVEADKIQVSGEFLTNYRAIKELETLAKLQDVQRENASKPRKNKGLEKPRQRQRAIYTEPEPDIEEEPKGSLSSDDDDAALHPDPKPPAKKPKGEKVDGKKSEDDIGKAVAAYNAAAEKSGWPMIRVLSRARKSALAARLKESGGLDGWSAALAKAQASPHCCGQNDRGWVANFDFLTRQSSFAKLMEGNYDNRPHHAGPSPHAQGRGHGASLASIAARRRFGTQD